MFLIWHEAGPPSPNLGTLRSDSLPVLAGMKSRESRREARRAAGRIRAPDSTPAIANSGWMVVGRPVARENSDKILLEHQAVAAVGRGSGRRIRSGFDGASNRDVADLRGSRRVKSAHGGADSGIAMPVFWLRSVEDRHEQSYSLCYALPSPPTSTFSALVSARQAARCTRKTSRARNLRIENQLRDEAVIAASVVPG